MALSGRFALLVALGVVPVVVAGIQGADAAWLALLGWLAARDRRGRARPRARGVAATGRADPVAARPGATRRDRHVGARGCSTSDRGRCAPSSVTAGSRRPAWPARTGPGCGSRRASGAGCRCSSPRGAAAIDARRRSRSARRGRSDCWSRQATLAAPGRVRVLPPFHSRAHLPSRLTRLRELDGRTPLLIRGQGTEFDSIREYVRGDDVRSIDWRATARHVDPEVPGSMRLMVRTWRPERDRRIVIVADTSRTAAARIDDEPRLDTAWEAVAPARRTRLARGRPRGLPRVGPEAPRPGARRRRAPSSSPAWSTPWRGSRPSSSRPTGRSVPGQVRRVTSHRALVVLLTAADSPGSARGLLSVLPQLTARHTVVVASVADPALLAARHERNALDEVYAASAAERGLLDGERGRRRHPPPRGAHRDGGAARAPARPRRLLPRAEGGRPALTRGSTAADSRHPAANPRHRRARRSLSSQGRRRGCAPFWRARRLRAPPRAAALLPSSPPAPPLGTDVLSPDANVLHSLQKGTAMSETAPAIAEPAIAAPAITAPSTMQKLTAEALGTFILVFGVIGTAIFAAGFNAGEGNLNVGFLGVALALGLSVLVGAYSFGPVSGGHFNPAVTLGLAVAGRFAVEGGARVPRGAARRRHLASTLAGGALDRTAVRRPRVPAAPPRASASSRPADSACSPCSSSRCCSPRCSCS